MCQKTAEIQILGRKCGIICHEAKMPSTWMKPFLKRVSDERHKWWNVLIKYDTKDVRQQCLINGKWFIPYNQLEFGLFNYILILVSGMILNAVLMETCGIAFVLPVSQCDLKLTTSEKGILGAVTFVGIICSSHLFGYLADTKGRRRIIQPTLFVAFLLSFSSSLVENFSTFVVLRFLNGFL